MRRASPWLKLIGIALFIAIIARLDRASIARYVRESDIAALCIAQIALFCTLTMKGYRWHILAAGAGLRRRALSSWQEYMIGVFLSTFTPAKLGDFGKIAYLRRDGVGAKTGALLVIIERLADIVVLVPLAILSAWILAQGRGLIIGLLGSLGLVLLMMITARFWSAFSGAVRYCCNHRVLAPVLWTTVGSWALHFLWAIIIARSLGILTPIPVLVAALTGASLLNALPIAPSGLGTREAALLTLLAPYGVESERIVALSLLMLMELLLAAVPGGWYWVRKKPSSVHPHAQDTGTLLP